MTKVKEKVNKMSQEDLEDELLVSMNKFMICSVCEAHIGYCNEHDEELMEDHFREAHGLKDEEDD